MAQWFPIQSNFSRGELSPRIYAGGASEYETAVRNSLKECSNALPLPQGAVQRRSGTHFVQVIDSTEARIFPYTRSNDEPWLMIYSDAKVTPYSPKQTLTDTPSDPPSSGNAVIENIMPQAGEDTSKLWVNTENYNQVMKLPSQGWWEFYNYPRPPVSYSAYVYTNRDNEGLPNGEWMKALIYSATVDVTYPISSVRIEADIDSIYREAYTPRKPDDSALDRSGYWVQIDVQLLADDGTVSSIASTKVFEISWLLANEYAYDAAIGGGYTGKLRLAIIFHGWHPTVPDPVASDPAPQAFGTIEPPRIDDTGLWEMITAQNTFGIRYINVIAQTGVTDVAPDIPTDTPVDPDAPTETDGYSLDALNDLQFVQSPYGDMPLITTHRKYPPKKLEYDPAEAGWAFSNLVAPDDEGENWATGSYPAVCTTYQGRLVAAGTDLNGQTVYLSKSGDWTKFKLPASDVTPEDPIEYTMSYQGRAAWAYGNRELLIGTANGEYVTTSQTGLLQAGDIDVREHGANGGRNVQAISTGDLILFVSNDGRKLYGVQYERSQLGWQAYDLTFMAEHITKSGIKRLAVTRNPDKIVWCLLTDGSLVGMAYNKSSEDLGWFRFATDGAVTDICTLRENGVDNLYMLIDRNFGGANALHLERLNPSDSQTFTDCSVTRRYSDDVSSSYPQWQGVIGDLAFLEGQQVHVKSVNEDYLGSFNVVNGEIAIDDDYIGVKQFIIGIQYTTRLITHPPFVDQNVGNLGSKKRYSNLGVRVINSMIPSINGTRPPTRNVFSVYDVSQQALTTQVDATQKGWSERQEVTISESLPYDLTLVGIYGKLTVNSL